MRAFAEFMMIQGHSVDALLSKDFYTDTFLFNIWLFNRGLTAPIFLFGSGFAYAIASSRKMVDGKLPRNVIVKRLRWIGVLFLIGTVMHLPVSSIHGLWSMSAAQWSQFLLVDVLRLMAVSLLGLFLMFMLIRKRRSLIIAAVSVALLIIAAAPLVYTVDWMNILPESLTGYMSTQTGSWFPIFPFTAYIFLGAAGGALYLEWKERGIEHRFNRYYFLAGVLLLAIAFVPRYVFESSLPLYYGSSSPWLTLSRLGWVLVLWAGVGTLINRTHSVPRLVQIAGQHSLFIYVSHIVVLYGSAWLPGFRQIFGKQLELLPVLIIISFLLVTTMYAARVIHTMKLEQMHVYRYVPYAAVVLLASVMIFA